MAGYTRQSAADIIDGNTVEAAPINKEYNQLQAAFSTTGHVHDGTTGNAPKINLTTSVSNILPVANGGSGLSSFATGKVLVGGDTALDLTKAAPTGDFVGTTDTQTLTNKTISGGIITGITDLAIADGGTGASTAAAARTNLGLGTAATTDSTAYATAAQGAKADSALQKTANLSDITNASSARANLGLGTIATHDVSEFQSSDPDNVLAQIKTVDGAGSGLDSDLLDGQHGSYYRAFGNMTGSATANQVPSIGSLTGADWLHATSGSTIGFVAGNKDNPYFRHQDNSLIALVSQSWAENRYRNASNLNAGTVPDARLSGTYSINITGNANTLDGLNSSQFLRSDTSDTCAGQLTANGGFVSGNQSFYTTTTNLILGNSGANNGTIYLRPNGIGSGSGQAYQQYNGNFTASGNITAYSDARLKTDVKELNGSLELINLLRPVEYIKNGHLEIGLIAQEVEQHIPEVVFEGEYDEDLGFAPKTIDYSRLVVDLIGAVKELTEQNIKMHQRILELEIKSFRSES